MLLYLKLKVIDEKMSETSPQQNLETADFVVIGVYFVLILAVGIWVRLSPYFIILSALVYRLVY